MYQELTTAEAADLLKVSPSHLEKLLDTGQIPFQEAGTQRILLPEHVQRYDQNLRETRRKSLEQLAQEAQDMGLGY
ncbi:helix-turn-helix domain-containing protein [Algoriphagus sp. H41]|uniref:Helix-turn-helix domain-containing protein n=1 Tax=Algoriphagus oliviformis TaxID=2811231 RepID=A0ABS3C152_9BACT|nr:helix-turn-helix domain-containing protein [Algoriphagus oliviformis]MBN7810848.1 helix-turn-helix domain-containing protein [Algoriphagus oliviformis]